MTTKLYAVVDKDGEIMVAYPATQFHNQFSETLKELHTYNPATQVVVDRDVYDVLAGYLRGCILTDALFCEELEAVNKFLSAGKG